MAISQQRPIHRSTLPQMESSRNVPSSSAPPSAPSSVAGTGKIKTSMSTSNTELLVATEKSKDEDTATAQSQTSRGLHEQYLQGPTPVLPPRRRFIDGHISLIIGILCGVVALGVLASGYSFWRCRKSRRRDPIVTVDRIFVKSSSPTEKADATSPSVEKPSRCCQIGSPPLRQPPPSNHFAPKVLTPSLRKSLGNQLQIEASQNPTPATHYIPGIPLQEGFPNFKHDKRQNFDSNPPSPSLRNFASPAGPFSYGLASYSYQHYSSCQQSSYSKQENPIRFGTPCNKSFPNASSNYYPLQSSSEDSGENLPARTITLKPFTHHPSSRQAHFSPPKMSPKLSNNPTAKPSPEYEAKFTTGSRNHPQNPTSVVYDQFVPFDTVSFNRPSHVLPRNANRPVLPRIHIPVLANNSGMPLCARGTPIPLILQPGCSISLPRQRLDSHKSSGSAHTDQILSPSQREIKASMFLPPCKLAPRTQAITSRPRTHAEDAKEEQAAEKKKSPKKSLGCAENTKPSGSPLPFPGQYPSFSKHALGASLP